MVARQICLNAADYHWVCEKKLASTDCPGRRKKFIRSDRNTTAFFVITASSLQQSRIWIEKLPAMSVSLSNRGFLWESVGDIRRTGDKRVSFSDFFSGHQYSDRKNDSKRRSSPSSQWGKRYFVLSRMDHNPSKNANSTSSPTFPLHRGSWKFDGLGFDLQFSADAHWISSKRTCQATARKIFNS